MSTEGEIKIKKRSRPATRIRERTRSPSPSASPAPEASNGMNTPLNAGSEEDAEELPLDELLELRRLRRARQGIDISKLNKGEPRRRKRADAEDDGSTTTPTGLIKGNATQREEFDEEKEKENKARRTIRQNNFTQQTNALDVDKHMMAYIEENMKLRRGEKDDEDTENGGSKPSGSQDDIYQMMEQMKTQQNGKKLEEGNVTNSLAMLTAIPEVDLGMDSRLRNIEETEKAKRSAADHRRGRRNEDEERLASTRFFKPNLRQKSDADIIRDAKLEAMGLRPDDQEFRRHHNDRPQTATDEMVMERFKKRMRK